MNNKFELYKQIKSLLDIKHKEIPLNSILSLELITNVYKGFNFKLMDILKSFFILNLKTEQQTYNTLLSSGRFGNRKDYLEIVQYIKNNLVDYEFLDFQKSSYKPHFNLKNFISIYSDYTTIKKLPVSRLEKIFLLFRCMHYKNHIDYYENLPSHYKQYVAFSGAHSYEALFTLLFHRKKLPTYSLQHGIYFIWKTEIPLDALAYENLISKYQLCWGQYTQEEFSNYGISNSSLLVGGYPRTVEKRSSPKSIKLKRGVVLLANYKYQEANYNLINLLISFNDGPDWYIKLHPSLDELEYKKLIKNSNIKIVSKEETIKSILSSDYFDFSIAINTASYYESFIYYKPSIRFNHPSYELSLGIEDDIFDDLVGLKRNLSVLKEIKDTQAYFQSTDKKLKYIIGLGVNNYNNYLNH